LIVLLNSSSSLFSSSSSTSGRSGGQKPHRLLRRRNASARRRSVAVMNPLHAGDAYVSRDTTTARKTAYRPASVIPWCRSTRRAYSDWALSLMTLRRWSDADKWLVIVTPRILSVCERCRAALAAVLQLFSAWSSERRSHSFLRRLTSSYSPLPSLQHCQSHEYACRHWLME